MLSFQGVSSAYFSVFSSCHHFHYPHRHSSSYHRHHQKNKISSKTYPSIPNKSIQVNHFHHIFTLPPAPFCSTHHQKVKSPANGRRFLRVHWCLHSNLCHLASLTSILGFGPRSTGAHFPNPYPHEK